MVIVFRNGGRQGSERGGVPRTRDGRLARAEDSSREAA